MPGFANEQIAGNLEVRTQGKGGNQPEAYLCREASITWTILERAASSGSVTLAGIPLPSVKPVAWWPLQADTEGLFRRTVPPRGVYEEFLLVGPGTAVSYAFEVGGLRGSSVTKTYLSCDQWGGT